MTLVLTGIRGQMESPETTVRQEITVLTETKVLLGLQELQGCQGNLDQMAQMVIRVLLEKMVIRVLLVIRVILEHKDQRGLKEHLVTMASTVDPELQEQKESPGRRVMRDPRGLPEPREIRVNKENRVRMVIMAQMAQMVILVIQALMVLMDQKVYRAHKVHREKKVTKEQKEMLENLDNPETMVYLDPMVNLEIME